MKGALKMCIEYKGYVIQQSTYNNHIMIIKENRMVMHSQCSQKLNEKQLCDLVDEFVKFTESAAAAALLQDLEREE